MTRVRPFVRTLLFLGLGLMAGSTPALAQDNLWSQASTWGGRVPGAGEHVVIPANRRVVLDISPPPLASLTVNGVLSFKETDLALTAGWIMVHGLFEIGSEAVAFQHRVVITLNGPLDEDIMGMGARFLGAMGGGRVEIHGARRESVDWTVLDADAQPGDTSILVTQVERIKLGKPLDWRPGDFLAIAPSGRDPLQAEPVTVTSVDGNRIHFTPPLRYPHLGGMRTIEGREVDMRAEVGLLTRNIVIQGAPDGWGRNLGGHVMSMVGTVLKIEGTELHHMGQAGRKGRYPIHWHLVGDVPGDYARFNSIWSSFHRAVAVHQTHRVEVRGNVAAAIASHTFVLEDGNEEGNVVEDNVGILTTRLPDEKFAFARENQPGAHGAAGQDEWRPATFWINNPRNTIRYNRAAGGINAIGFFFDDPHGRMPASPLYTNAGQAPVPVVPAEHFPEVFSENLAHSYLVTDGGAERNPLRTAGYGLMVRAPERPGGTTFDRFTAYQNSNGGAWLENNGERLQQATLVDNAAGAVLFRASLSDALVVGQTPWALAAHPPATQRGGVNVIGLYGGGKAPRVQRVTFVNAQPAAVFVESDHLLPANLFEQIALVGTPTPVSLRDRSIDHTWEGALLDADGSLTGTGVPTLVTGTPIGDSTFRAGWGTYAPGGAYTTPQPAASSEAPSGLTAWVEGSTVGLAWVAPSGAAANGYVLEAGSLPGASDYLTLPLGPATSQTFSGLSNLTAFVRVRAQTPALTAPSNEIRLVVGQPSCELPEAPTNLTANVVGRSVALHWTPGAGTTLFGLLAGSGPGLSNIFVGAIGTTASFGAAVPPGTYYARVIAANACGLSATSNEVTIQVQ